MAMRIDLSKTRKTLLTIRRPHLARMIERAAEAAGLDDVSRLSLRLVDPGFIAGVNAEFVGHEGPTDVITFDYRDDSDEPDDDTPQAELLVCPALAAERAAEMKCHPSRELVLYIVHGLLHLAGHDDGDPTQRKAMRAAERRVLKTLSKEFDLDATFDFQACVKRQELKSL